MKIINLDDDNTFPEELLHILSNRAYQLKDEKDKEAKFTDLRWSRPFETPITDSTIYEISNIITSYKIWAYHCTRLLNPQKILTTGLCLLTPEMHKEILTESMKAAKCSIAEIKLAFELLNNFREKNNYKNREGMIWFILSRKMAESRDDCGIFFRQVGGEVTEKVLSGQGDSILSRLSLVGTPVLVECVLPIKDAAGFQIDDLVKNFIRYGIETFAEKRKFHFYCEMFVKHEVDKDAIKNISEAKLISIY